MSFCFGKPCEKTIVLQCWTQQIKLFNEINSFSKSVDLIGFAYVLRCSDFQKILCLKIFRFPRLIKIPPSQNYVVVVVVVFVLWKPCEKLIFLARQIRKIHKYHVLMSDSFHNLGNFNLLKCWAMKIIWLNTFPYFLVLFETSLQKKGVERYLVDVLEVPKIIQKVLQDVREPKLAILE